jgi:hypothetical protein
MACRGVHFAIEPLVMNRLIDAKSDAAAVLDIVQQEMEQPWEESWLHETDKSWDALQRCLSDGTLNIPARFTPLPAAVLGGEHLYAGDDYVISLVRPELVRSVADALAIVTKEWLRKRYDALSPRDYDGDIGDEDFEYTWNWFQGLPELFERAARAGRAVVFTVDQ